MKKIVYLILITFLVQSCTHQSYKIENDKIINNIDDVISQKSKPKILVLFDMNKSDYFIKESKSRLAENILSDNRAFYMKPEDIAPYFFVHQKIQRKLIQKENSVNEQVFPLMHSYHTINLSSIGNYKVILEFPNFYEQLDKAEQNNLFRDYVFYIAIPPTRSKDFYDIYKVDLVEIERIN